MKLESKYDLGQQVYLVNTLDKDAVLYGTIVGISLYDFMREEQQIPIFLYRISTEIVLNYTTLEPVDTENKAYKRYSGNTFAFFEEHIYLNKEEIKTN